MRYYFFIYFTLTVKIMMINPLEKCVRVDGFLPPDRCKNIIDLAEQHGKWQTKRHKNYPTTDIPVPDIRGLDLQPELDRVVELTTFNYNLEKEATLTPFDVFVVRYDADGQNHLGIHRDKSELSFVLLLSDPTKFEGGGTYYEHANMTISPGQGDLVLHCGKVRHAGNKVTKGTRYVLIGFIDVTSRRIGKYHKQESQLSNHLPDKRHLDFLWRHNTQPMTLSIRIINLKDQPNKLKATLDTLRRLKTPNNWILDIQPCITNGELLHYGVFSHLHAIQQSDAEFLLVLEDNADFHSDFLWRVDQSIQELQGMEWDAIDFGNSDDDPVLFTQSLVKRVSTMWTHCMLYNKQGITKLKTISTSAIYSTPFSEALAGMRGIHPKDHVNKLYDVSLNVLHSYLPLSWRRAHDPPTSWTLEASVEPSDMQNYYQFANATDLSQIPSLLRQANKKMWNFQLNCVKSAENNRWGEWLFPVDHEKKVTIVVHPTHLWIQKKHTTELTCAEHTIYFFPSYLRFKYNGGYLMYGCGGPFH